MSKITLTYFQKGFNYSQDGQGNRLVYHLGGCNMHCPWCSNPEGMDKKGNYKTVSVDEIYDEILSCKPMFFDGGGVTFTGGECTLQAKSLCALFSRLRDAGISTAIESNASTPDFLSVARLCDILLADFKHPTQNGLSLIGGKLSLVKQNIFAIAKEKTVHIRIPLIGGFNDDDISLYGFCQFFKELQNLNVDFDVELLPYHEYGKEKWQKLGLDYTVTNGFVSKDTLNKFNIGFKNINIKLIRT